MKTSNVQKHNQATANKIEELMAQAEDMRKQLELFNSEIRVVNQQHKAQESFAKEWQTALKTIAKLAKDGCSAYGSEEFLQDMVEDVQTIVGEVTENFGEHAQSDRFLNAETAEMEDSLEEVGVDNKSLNGKTQVNFTLAQPMPDRDDNETVLSKENATKLIEHLDKDELTRLSGAKGWGRKSSVKTISLLIHQNGMSRSALEQLLSVLFPPTLSIAV